MAITIEGSGITSANIADGTITTDDILASDVSSLKSGRKNLIINGDMKIAQRGTSFTGLTASIGYKTVDRFGGNSYNVGSHTYNDEQSTDAPTEFSFSRKFTWTTASTTSSNSRNQMRHHIEFDNMSHLKWGTSNAKTATLSFWVKSSVTGKHPVSLVAGTETISFVANYTIYSANTWEYKTILIPAPTSGTFTGNDIGIRMAWDFGSGSTYDAPSEDTWVSGWYFRSASSVRVSETTNATWQITGVQLELGSVATDFEHRSFGEELALCQRYYEKSFNYGDTPANGSTTTTLSTNAGRNFSDIVFWHGNNVSGINMQVEKRVSPTVTRYGNSQGYWGYLNASTTAPGSDNTHSFHANLSAQANGTKAIVGNNQVSGSPLWGVIGHWTASAEL